MENFWEIMFDLADYMHEQAFAAFSREFHDSSLNFTVGQMRLVRCVEQLTRHSPEGVSLRQVAEYLGTTAGTASTAVNQLVERGVLERNVNPDDRRAVNIVLSSRIRDITTAIKDGFDREFSEVAAQLSAREAAACAKACRLVMQRNLIK